MFKRIIAFLLVIAIVFFCFPVISYAALVPADKYYGETTNYWTLFDRLANTIRRVCENFNEYLVEVDAFLQEVHYYDLLDTNVKLYCESADSETGGRYPYHYWEGGLSSSSRFCKYCGLAYSDYIDDSINAESDYVTSISGETALAFHCFRSYEYAGDVDTLGNYANYERLANYIDDFAGSFDGLNLVLPNADSYGYEVRFSSGPLSLAEGFYTVPSINVEMYYPEMGVLGCCPFAIHVVRYDPVEDVCTVLGSRAASRPSDYYLESVSYTTNPLRFYATPDYLYFVTFGYTSCVNYLDLASGLTFSSPISLISSDSHSTVYDPTDTEQSEDEKYSEDTRVAALMELLALFNETCNYQENSDAVNFFMGTLDENGNISGYYELPQFDEETMVFTEPVTGAQYQTTGWTYDYSTRSYDIALDSGTFTILGTDITRIVCTYGDEAVTISYYDSSGNLVRSDEYAYVMVASSSCALEGHSYTVETTKEPTCTSVGERVYTCSTCGDQKVEEIPMNEHAYVYTVIKEATCTDPGYGTYTCSTCGGQYTENMDPLGHDWLSTEVVETSYSLPPGTACPDCEGTDFSCELDTLNAVYSCTCNSCGTAWTVNAEVTLGYTTYTCSRCGETKVEFDGDEGDGLFKSIGNFIADGINWCTEKLAQLVDSLTTIVDTFNDYLDKLPQGGDYPGFLSLFLDTLPEELTAVIWLAVIAFVVLAVIKIWFR